MRMISCIVIVAALLVTVAACWAETDTTTQSVGLAVNEIAEISVVGVVGNLTIDNPTLGGNEPAVRSSDSSYLQYTSIVPESAPGVLKTRQIEAQITSGIVPPGTTLTLHAEPGIGSPAVGVIGSRIGADEKDLGIMVLGAYPSRPLVDGIKCGWTSTDPPDTGAGARLFYTFKVYDWSAVFQAPGRAITVTYTLMDPV